MYKLPPTHCPPFITAKATHLVIESQSTQALSMMTNPKYAPLSTRPCPHLLSMYAMYVGLYIVGFFFMQWTQSVP